MILPNHLDRSLFRSTKVVGTDDDLNWRLGITTFMTRDWANRFWSCALIQECLGSWLVCIGSFWRLWPGVTGMVAPVMVVVMVSSSAIVFDHRVSLGQVNPVQALLATVLWWRSINHWSVNWGAALTAVTWFTVGWWVLRPRRCQVWIDMLHGLVVGRWGAFPTSGKCGAQKREESGGWSEGRNVRIIAQRLDGTHIQATFDHG